MKLLWRHIKPHGIENPVPRRRQCCLVINHQMFMFGGTSPISRSTLRSQTNEIQDTDALRTDLHDQSDLYVLDFGIVLFIYLFNILFSLHFSSNFKNIMLSFSCKKNHWHKYSSEKISSRISIFCTVNFNRTKQWIIF